MDVRRSFIVGLAAALLSYGCNGRAHDGGDEAADADGPKQDMGSPDVGPDSGDGEDCGGADLQTDDLNCGACSVQCSWTDVGDYPTGHCVGGDCAPTWGACELADGGATCADQCGSDGCAANGCNGLTALLYRYPLGQPDATCHNIAGAGIEELTIGCEDTIPYDQDSSDLATCCCNQVWP